jgi:uncharacterized protein (TIGR02246 family)
MKLILSTLFLAIGLLCVDAAMAAGEGPAARRDVELAPELLELLRAEMREITAGTQSMAVALVTGDWQSIVDTSGRIRDSYIMQQQLTPEQTKTLEQALPERFKQLDLELHGRAERVGAAAAAHDAERAAYELSRLLETCTACHTAFAESRFPGFPSPTGHEGHHPAGPDDPASAHDHHAAVGSTMTGGDLHDFARQYTEAWCSQDPGRVASFFAEDGSLTINQGLPSVGRTAIAAAARDFMDAFPDLVVSMDGLERDGDGYVYRWTLTGTNTGPGGNGNFVRISGYEEWALGADGLIARSLGHFDEADYQRQIVRSAGG